MNESQYLEIGAKPKIGKYVSLGEAPNGLNSSLIIGNCPTIRSHTVIYRGTRIGDNFQTGHGVLIRENNTIGNNVSIGSHSVVECENFIEDDVRIHSNCFIPEFVHIKKKAWIGPCVTILNVLHPPCPKWKECAKGIEIGQNVKIGGNATIGPRVSIRENSLIGCGSVVVADVPSNTVVAGNPAKKIKSINELKCVLGYFEKVYEWDAE